MRLNFLHHVQMTLGVLLHNVFNIVGFAQLVKLFLRNKIFHSLNAPNNILLVWSYAKSLIISLKVTSESYILLFYFIKTKNGCVPAENKWV